MSGKGLVRGMVIPGGGGGATNAITNINISAGTTSNLLSAFTFSNANGVSFGLDASTITATVKTDYLTTAALSNHSHGASAANGSFGFQTLSFSNAQGVSFATSAGNAIVGSIATTYAGTGFTSAGNNIGLSGTLNTAGLSLSATVAAAANPALSAANGSFTFQTASFSNLNGISFGTSAGSAITASHNALTSQSNQAFSAAGGSSAFQTLPFADTNLVSFTNTGGSVGIASVKLSMFAVSNTTQSSAGTANHTALSFAGAGVASVGITGGSVVISVPAGAPSPVNFSAGTTSSDLGSVVFSNSNGVSFGLNGSTITAQVSGQTISSYQNVVGLVGSSALTFNQTSISFAQAFNMPQPGSFSFLRIPALMTTNSTTIATLASATATASGGLFSTINAVIYSLGVGANSRSLQSVTSGSAGYTMRQSISISNSTQGSYTLEISGQANGDGTTRTTQYSISNTNYSFTTNQIATEFSTGRFLDVPFAASLSAGAYWLVIGMSTSTASAGAAGLAALTNCNVRYSNHYGLSQANVAFGIFGSTNMTSGGQLGNGFFSTAGGGTTNSIPISAISSTASNPIMFFQLLRSA